MRRESAEAILGEWGVRDVTPPSQVERARLAADRELNPLRGEPLRRRVASFDVSPDRYLAALGGPLPYMRRLKQIEEETAQHLTRLEAARGELADDHAAWRRLVEGWDFGELN